MSWQEDTIGENPDKKCVDACYACIYVCVEVYSVIPNKMINSFFRSVIILSILYGFVFSGCWEGNQMNHKILDLKENEGIFNHIAYDLEDGLLGNKTQYILGSNCPTKYGQILYFERTKTSFESWEKARSESRKRSEPERWMLSNLCADRHTFWHLELLLEPKIK